MSRPRTIKLLLPTDLPVERHSYVNEQGELITYEQYRQLVVPSKKNQKRAITNPKTLRAYIIPSEQYITWRKENLSMFEEFYFQLEAAGVRLPIVRCNISLQFYYPDSKTRDNHNKFETIADMLVEAGILGDDSFKVLADTRLKGYTCRHQPRTEIYLTILEPAHKDYEWDITDPARHKKRKQARNTKSKQRARIKERVKEGKPNPKYSQTPEAIRQRESRHRRKLAQQETGHQ